MTATSAGSSVPAKGLDISLAALQRQDPYINNIVDVASQVALYTYNNRANEWEKTEVEGTLFIYTRLASPRHGFTIMNRLSMENLTEPITKDLDFQLQDPFLLYRNARLVIHGIWFYDKDDCQRIAQRMTCLTQQEQVQAQAQSRWLSSPGHDAKTVDIIQMLLKARCDYDKEKSSYEPKEIGGSSVLHGNPNLIKPIPVKPSSQENDGALCLSLFGTQPKQRPPVVRTLTYEQAQADRQTGCHNDTAQHCPAVQKLMQVHRGVLQTVSESPENRLSDNGVRVEVQEVSAPHAHPHHHHHHHLLHHGNLQQQQDPRDVTGDHLKRLLQNHTLIPCTTQQPITAQQVSHPLNQPIPLSQPQIQPGMFHRPPMENQQQKSLVAPPAPLTGQAQGMVSPHELLLKLQIVQQQQQSLTPDPTQSLPQPLPQSLPQLAPRFMSPPQTLSDSAVHQASAPPGHKGALQFQDVSPLMLLAPSVFSQTKTQDKPPSTLTKRQLQSTLLDLIQNDASFLDSIYEAYIIRTKLGLNSN